MTTTARKRGAVDVAESVRKALVKFPHRTGYPLGYMLGIITQQNKCWHSVDLTYAEWVDIADALAASGTDQEPCTSDSDR